MCASGPRRVATPRALACSPAANPVPSRPDGQRAVICRIPTRAGGGHRGRRAAQPRPRLAVTALEGAAATPRVLGINAASRPPHAAKGRALPQGKGLPQGLEGTRSATPPSCRPQVRRSPTSRERARARARPARPGLHERGCDCVARARVARACPHVPGWAMSACYGACDLHKLFCCDSTHLSQSCGLTLRITQGVISQL